MIEDCVRTLARKHNSVRFVRLHYQDAEMEPAGVPAIIAYRGGDKFAGLVPIMEELPDNAELSSLTLEAVMMRYVSPKHFVAGVIANVCDIDTRSCHRIGLAKTQFHPIRPAIARTSALVGEVIPSCLSDHCSDRNSTAGQPVGPATSMVSHQSASWHPGCDRSPLAWCHAKG
jgi:hypothetical protein